jgi:uncharacterized protein YbbK (DUF523 family)
MVTSPGVATIRIAVSACLLGERVRYHGGHARKDHDLLDRWIAEGRVVSICPEVLAGLGTPRPSAEIVQGRVRTADGADLTATFQEGAEIALAIAEEHRVRIAILKNGSPSCGTTYVYDGSFRGTKVAGEGLAAAALRAHGIAVFHEDQLEAAAHHLAHLECGNASCRS